MTVLDRAGGAIGCLGWITLKSKDLPSGPSVALGVAMFSSSPITPCIGSVQVVRCGVELLGVDMDIDPDIVADFIGGGLGKDRKEIPIDPIENKLIGYRDAKPTPLAIVIDLGGTIEPHIVPVLPD